MRYDNYKLYLFIFFKEILNFTISMKTMSRKIISIYIRYVVFVGSMIELCFNSVLEKLKILKNNYYINL